ncbi:glycosyltransferase [Halorussus salilacus]|uniref:glycosyltransferase family 2 protein n=1 Tax=Halorussus salilacus TaxID=2953750 RepID=UPI0020A2248E|nr:glycosyltransferase family 2 protein [Halorussus salilacus]USZ67356.1 glycosyltransferase [Halorussus salilacus]
MSPDAREEGLVSVVIPTFYRNDRLREALDSVVGQEYAPIETVVVDSSADATARSVVEEFEGVEYVPTERDEGPQAARSLGAERASGAYVQFLDDDDRLAPDKLRKQVPLLDPPVGVVYSGMVDEDRGELLPNPEVRGDVLEYALEMRTFPCINSTMLIDADVLAKILPLGHRHGADDTGTKIELALHTEFDFVNEPLVHRGRTDSSLSDSWAYLEGRKRVIETFADVYRRFPPRVRRRALRETHYQAGRKLIDEQGWSPRATAEFARAAYYTPDRRADYVGECLGSVLGRPGVRAADRLLS